MSEAKTTTTSYREEVRRTSPTPKSVAEALTLGAFGLAGECGEVVDLLKKVLFHGAPLDRDALIKELGDVRWYLESLALAIDVSMEAIEEANVAKLRARYPHGFRLGGGVR